VGRGRIVDEVEPVACKGHHRLLPDDMLFGFALFRQF
jgi:hypothetical protein